VFLDALDQRAYAPRRLVERLRQLADLVLRGHLKAGVVIATRQLDAMSRKLAQWYHDLPSDRHEGQKDQQGVDGQQQVHSIEHLALHELHVGEYAAHERLGAFQEPRRMTDDLFNYGVDTDRRRHYPGQLCRTALTSDLARKPQDGLPVHRPLIVHRIDAPLVQGREPFYIEAEDIATVGKCRQHRLEVGNELAHLEFAGAHSLSGRDGLQGNALTQHAQLARNVDRVGHAV